MTMLKLKNQIILSTCLFLCLLFTSCYEEQTGCQDIQAFNYDAAADDVCPPPDKGEIDDCCNYNQLNVQLSFVFDSLAFSLNSTYPLESEDSINVRDAYILLSNFEIDGESNTGYQVMSFADFDGDGSASNLNDIIKADFRSLDEDLGDLMLKDDIKQVRFKQGLLSSINDSLLNYSDNDGLEEIVDSAYVDEMNRLAFFRIEFWKINIDTTEYVFSFFEESLMADKTISLDTSIHYNNHVELKLEADLAKLFSGVDANFLNIEDKLKENLDVFISKEE